MTDPIKIPESRAIFATTDYWRLYRRPFRPGVDSPLWAQFKLLNRELKKKRGRRRVFDLVWSVNEQRLRRDHNTATLAKQQPALYEAVNLALRQQFAPDLVRAVEGDTAWQEAQKREAERARHTAERKAVKAAEAVDIFS